MSYRVKHVRFHAFPSSTVVWRLSDCPFRTLFWNSEAILPEILKSGEAELATDAFIPHNRLFL